MAPQTGAGIEGLKAVGLGLGGVDDLPEVDVHFIAQLHQLVYQTDIHIAVGIFQNLLHLGNGRGGDGMHLGPQHCPVDGSDAFGGILADGAHHLGGVLGLIDQVAGIHPLRGEAQIEVLAAGKAGGFQNGL